MYAVYKYIKKKIKNEVHQLLLGSEKNASAFFVEPRLLADQGSKGRDALLVEELCGNGVLRKLVLRSRASKNWLRKTERLANRRPATNF